MTRVLGELAEAKRKQPAPAAPPAAEKPKPGKPTPKGKGKVAEARKEVADATKRFLGAMGNKLKGLWADSAGSLDLDSSMSPEVMASLKDMIRAYMKLGAATFDAVVEMFEADNGHTLSTEGRSLFRSIWDDLKPTEKYRKPKPDASLYVTSKLARQVMRDYLEFEYLGVPIDEIDVKKVIADVHKTMAEIMGEDWTEGMTQAAVAGTGLYKEPSRGEIDVKMTDLLGQAQALEKLLAMSEGEPPSRYGQGRQEMSDTLRGWVKKVEAEKRKGGYDVTDPDRQARSAFQAAVRTIENRIHDMRKAIAENAPITKRETQYTAEQKALLAELQEVLAEVKEDYAAKFPKEPLSEAEIERRKLAAMDRAIELFKADEAAGFPKKARPTQLSTDAIKKKQAELDELRALRAEVVKIRELAESIAKLRDQIDRRDVAKPVSEKEEVANQQIADMQDQLRALYYKREILRQTAELRERIAAKDFAPKPKQKTKYDQETRDLQFERKKARDKYKMLSDEWAAARRSVPAKILYGVGDIASVMRVLMTTLDHSFMGRQGWFAVVSHPGVAAKAYGPSVAAAFSAKREFEEAANIEQRGNFKNGYYEAMKLDLATTQENLTRQEEVFFGRWKRYLKWLGYPEASQRAYVTAANRMRADIADIMVDTFVQKHGEPTDAELDAIGHYVNVLTGRGGRFPAKYEAAMSAMTFFLFSPRLLASRFQLAVGEPYLRAPSRVKNLIAAEYGRIILGQTVFLGSIAMAGMLFYDDDDEDKPRFVWDPRSSDFGKIVMGDTRIDVFGGMAQIYTLLARTGLSSWNTLARQTGQAEIPEFRSSTTGELRFLSGPNKPYAGLDTWDVITRFARSKASPAIGFSMDWITGENVLGELTTIGTIGAGSVFPLSARDSLEAATGIDNPFELTLDNIRDGLAAKGIGTHLAQQIASFHGMGMMVYGTRYQDPESEVRRLERRLNYGLSLERKSGEAYGAWLRRINARNDERGLTAAERLAEIELYREEREESAAELNRMGRGRPMGRPTPAGRPKPASRPTLRIR